MDPQVIDEALIRATVDRARVSTRGRTNYNFHSGPAENPHRFLNVLMRGSYVAPHRHVTPPKSETFLVLEGLLALFCFYDHGSVQSVHLLGNARGVPLPEHWRKLPVGRGIDLPAGIWHTVTAVSEYAACLEVKPGPWDPATDKEFAAWAPKEGDSAAAEYLERLLQG